MNIVPPLVRRAARLFSQALLFVLCHRDDCPSPDRPNHRDHRRFRAGISCLRRQRRGHRHDARRSERRERPVHHRRGSARDLHPRGETTWLRAGSARGRRRHRGSGNDGGLQGPVRRAAPAGDGHHRRRRSDGGNQGAVHGGTRHGRRHARAADERRRVDSGERSPAWRSFLRRSRATESAFSCERRRASTRARRRSSSSTASFCRTSPRRRRISNSLDIESIEVVKGAAGASLYGSKAANGVIQIRTARGNGLVARTNAIHRSLGVRRQLDEPRREAREVPLLSDERRRAST